MSTPFLTGFLYGNAPEARLAFPMGIARGARTPLLGKRLRDLREAKGKHASLEFIAQQMVRLGFTRTNRSTIHKYEDGRPPDFGMLIGLARVYDQPFTDLCLLMASELSEAIGAPTEVPPLPPSDEALQIARAFDAGPESLQKLLRQAVNVSQDSSSGRSPRAPAAGAPAAGAGASHERKRRRASH